MALQWKPIKNLFNCQSLTFPTFTGTQRRANNDCFPKDGQHSPSRSNVVTNFHHCLLHLQSTGLNMLTISAILSTPCYQLITTHCPPKCATTWPSRPAVPEAPGCSVNSQTLQSPKPWITSPHVLQYHPLRQKEKGTAEDEMVGWHHWLSGHEFK